MNKLIACALLLAPAAAFASAQTHHCEIDGKEVAKTNKQCKEAKGTWAKGAPTTTPATPAPASPASGGTRSNGTPAP